MKDFLQTAGLAVLAVVAICSTAALIVVPHHLELVERDQKIADSHIVVTNKIDHFGYGKVIEIYSDHSGGKIVVENSQGERLIVNRDDEIPVRGDWYSLVPKFKPYCNEYQIGLDKRVYNGPQKTLELDAEIKQLNALRREE